MVDETITSAEACQAAHCNPTTLRTWHNRVGFLPRADTGWRRYPLADLIAIRMMVILTEKGMRAQEAVDITHALAEQLRLAAHGAGAKVAVGRDFNGNVRAEKIDPLSDADHALDFDDEFVLVLDLRRIASRMFDAVRELRGLPPLHQSLDLSGPKGDDTE